MHGIVLGLLFVILVSPGAWAQEAPIPREPGSMAAPPAEADAGGGKNAAGAGPAGIAPEESGVAAGGGGNDAKKSALPPAPSGKMEETPVEGTPTDRIVSRFMALDTDASGGVSFDEYMAWVEQRAKTRFEAMDTDGDGEVSDAEYRLFWKSRLAHWYRLKR